MLSNRAFHEWGHDEKALKGVLAYIERYGPYDGLYGFSPGRRRRHGPVGRASPRASARRGPGASSSVRVRRPAAGRRDGRSAFFANIGRRAIPSGPHQKRWPASTRTPVFLEHAGGHELPLKLRHDARFKDAPALKKTPASSYRMLSVGNYLSGFVFGVQGYPPSMCPLCGKTRRSVAARRVARR